MDGRQLCQNHEIVRSRRQIMRMSAYEGLQGLFEGQMNQEQRMAEPSMVK